MFDRGHLARGIACLRSYLQHGGTSAFALCLEEGYEDKLSAGVVPLRLAELEARWPSIAATKATRERRSYIYSLKAFLAEMVLDRVAEGDEVLYADSDMFFFGDPREIKLGELTFGAALVSIRSSLRFNAGLFLCRRSAFLSWWQSCVLACCHTLAWQDEMYLNLLLEGWLGSGPLPQEGVNVGHWSQLPPAVVCYHFQAPLKIPLGHEAFHAAYDAALEEVIHGLD